MAQDGAHAHGEPRRTFFACCPTHRFDTAICGSPGADGRALSPFYCDYIQFYDELEKIAAIDEPACGGPSSAKAA